MGPLGLYVHIPFCASICNYCNFNRGLLDEALKQRYVTALETDIHRAARARAVDTIYFGGGTPSLLSPGEVGTILRAARESFDVDPDAEITLEANPETVTPDSLAGYRAAGVTRLSFGVQSFHDEELRRLERRHDVQRAERAFGDARTAGFANISLDLMLWLPGQSVDAARQSAARLVALGPEHASVYLLELYANAPLGARMAREGWMQVEDDAAADMYLACMADLEAAGFEHYEISNFARPGRQSRHNLKYWTDGEWVGVGCGAHSTVGHVRWSNVLSAGDYIRRVDDGRSVEATRRELTPREQLEEALFMGLRLTSGVSLAAILERYGVDVWQTWERALAPSVEAGLLVHEEDRLRLTKQGFLVSNEVMSAFLGSGSTVK
jgi:oxygen-independent coproporphyrinogen-3 oxidase